MVFIKRSATRLGRRRLEETIDVCKAPILKIQPPAILLGTALRKNFAELHIKKELDKIAALCNN
jgi:hypothetical protein